MRIGLPSNASEMNAPCRMLVPARLSVPRYAGARLPRGPGRRVVLAGRGHARSSRAIRLQRASGLTTRKNCLGKRSRGVLYLFVLRRRLLALVVLHWIADVLAALSPVLLVQQ